LSAKNAKDAKSAKHFSYVFVLFALFAGHKTFAHFAISHSGAGNASLMPAYVADYST